MKETAKAIGNYGEDLAERYLKKRGWRILSRNFSVRGGEIDIIGYRGGRLVFFEVKARTGEAFGKPHEAVDAEKVANIRKTARAFLTAYRFGGKISVFYPFGIEIKRKIRKQRIDVIEVYLGTDRSVKQINHIKDWEKRL
jgi:putative endonuclease